MDALLRHGATPDAQDALGLTPAGAALLRGHLEVVQALVEWGAEVKERPGGFSMLHLAAGVGRHEAVEWILAGSRDDVNGERTALSLQRYPKYSSIG